MIDEHTRARFRDSLSRIDTQLDKHYPGAHGNPFDTPQPSHTVYINAADAHPSSPQNWGQEALETAALGSHILNDLVDTATSDLVTNKLTARPIDDLRIDFEDGYGFRPDDVEDHDAHKAGHCFRQWAQDPTAPRYFGIRAKGLGSLERDRGLRTIEKVFEAMGFIPERFVFTIPKLRSAAQVDAVVEVCASIERYFSAPEGTLKFELQIESPQAIIGADGTVTVASAIHRSRRRCSGLHYGTYDYSAACGIASKQQALDHPVADFAKGVMMVVAAQTGVWLSDGSTQIKPGANNMDSALRRHFALVTRSLQRGFYQGWDMYPGHLVTRWAATFAFFTDAMPTAAMRLEKYFAKAKTDIVDEPATAQALAAVILRGLGTGAFTEDELLAHGPHCTLDNLNAVTNRNLIPENSTTTLTVP